MYGRIGLKTARGSGTTGYIQKNRATYKKSNCNSQFSKELKENRKNNKPIKKQPSKEIIDYMNYRQIYVILEDIKENLLKENNPEEKINHIIEEKENELLGLYNKGENWNSKSIYNEFMNKINKENNLKKALDKNYQWGDAFDFEKMEKEKLEEIYKKENLELKNILEEYSEESKKSYTSYSKENNKKYSNSKNSSKYSYKKRNRYSNSNYKYEKNNYYSDSSSLSN